MIINNKIPWPLKGVQAAVPGHEDQRQETVADTVTPLTVAEMGNEAVSTSRLLDVMGRIFADTVNKNENNNNISLQ